MPPTYTPQQKLAIETRSVSVALSAGAGCGKTFVLTQRFLSHLRPGPDQLDLGSIVAITFTDKAAREMRDRIRSATQQALLACPAEDVDYWRGILWQLDSARVSTIHAFCTSLLRSQAIEAGLDPRFNVLDAPAAASLLREAVRTTMHRLLEANDPDIAFLIRHLSYESVFDRLRSLVPQRYRIEFETFPHTDPDELARVWESAWFRDHVPQQVRELLAAPRTKRLRELLAGTPCGNPKMEARRLEMLRLFEVVEGFLNEQAAANSSGMARPTGVAHASGVARSESSKGVAFEQAGDVRPEVGGTQGLLFSDLPSPASRLPPVQDTPFAEPQGVPPRRSVPPGDAVGSAVRTDSSGSRDDQDGPHSGPYQRSPQEFSRLLLENVRLLREQATVANLGKTPAWEDEGLKTAIQELLTKLRDGLDKLKELDQIDPDATRFAADVGLRLLRVTRQAVERYEAAKKQAGALDFDDLLLYARNLLRDRLDVREQLANSIRLLMVDEFQDTDPIQADLVRMLCGDQLTRGKLFLVGDIKQSIYRFRRADPDVFRTLRLEIPPDGRLPLSVNFRSQPAILHFVNILFGPAMGAEYEALVPRGEALSTTPLIEFLWATEPAATSDDEPAGKAAARELRQWEADWIARRIAVLLQDETPRVREKLPSGETTLRRVRPGDITLLFRALSDVALYEDALRRQDLDYYLVGGRAFYAQQEIYDVVNLLQYLADATELVSLVGVLRSPFFNLSDDVIQALSLHNLMIPEALADPPETLTAEERAQVTFAHDVLTELRELRDRVPLYELLEVAIDRTGYDAALLNEYLGRRKVANLRKLVEQARLFDHGSFATLKEFVAQLQESIQEESQEELAATHPEASDVIRLMSIHQSKGLEFPVVFVADMNRKGAGQGPDAVLHGEWGALISLPPVREEERPNLALTMHKAAEQRADAAESLRLLYVALTRAADLLICSAGIEPDLKPSSSWMQTIADRFHLETGLPVIDPYVGTFVGGRESIPDVVVHRKIPQPRDEDRAGRATHWSLSHLLNQLPETEPADFPRLVAPIEPCWNEVRLASVSQLESCLLHEPVPEHDAESLPGEPALPPNEAEIVGNLVHAVLERVDFAQPDQVEELLGHSVRRSVSEIEETLSKRATNWLTRLRQSPLWGELTDCRQLQREQEFLLRWPPEPGTFAVDSTLPSESSPLGILGLIDALYEDADGAWHVIDYKTGNAPQTVGDASLLGPYHLQLATYALAATLWLGHPPASVSLIYAAPKYRRVSLELTPECLRRSVELLDAAVTRLRQGVCERPMPSETRTAVKG